MSAKAKTLAFLAGGLLFSAGIGIGRHASEGTRLATLDAVARAEEATSSVRRPPPGSPDLMSFADVAEQVTPAVVTVRTDKKVKMGGEMTSPFGDFFQFFPNMPRGGTQRTHDLGSGFIVDPKGVVVTNNHVIDGADRITVRLHDGRQLDAKLVGADPKSDVAVLRIEGGPFPSVRTGDDQSMRVGEWVLAVGSPFGEQLESSVTAGIISAKGRGSVGLADYEDYLQTDAAINPGNSGGPLVNLRGEVIGMNTAIASRSGGYQGVGFAIPITMVRNIMDQLVATGKVTRSWLGVTIQEINPDMARGLKLDETSGILVSDVVKDSPAGRAGIEDGDVIVSMDGEAAGSVPQFRNRVASTKPGETVKLEIMRENSTRTVSVKLEEKPADEVASAAGGSNDREAPEHGLGLELRNLTPALAQQFNLEDRSGVVVTGVEPGSAAEDAGLRPGDVVRSVNRKPVQSVADLKTALGRIDSKDPVVLQVRREDRSFFVTLTRES